MGAAIESSLLGRSVTSTVPRGAIGFAEKVLELLDEGRYTATYKYAVLLALIDVCLETTADHGRPPDAVTTRQLADKVVELYWPHTAPFSGRTPLTVLRQSSSGQAEIVSVIERFRREHAVDPSVPRWEARAHSREAYERLVRTVEWKLIQMPLPRLQTMGHGTRSFIYELGWEPGVGRTEVSRYQSDVQSAFDNRLLLKPGVGEYLLQLSGLLRPLIQRRWAAMVAQVNTLEESQLDAFLFGADRTTTARVRGGLLEIQDGRCFYCDRRLAQASGGHVDHFVPWSRYPENGLDNLVVAHRECNLAKSSSLAAAEHVAHWVRRTRKDSSEYPQVAALALRTPWDRNAERAESIARAIYLRLPDDASLWQSGREFVAPDRELLRRALASPEA